MIEQGWQHVHFAERLDGVYINPLRPGGLGPYTDATAPTIAEVSLVSTDDGSLAVLANAYDTPSIPVPGAWANEPVTPALLRWRVVRDGRPVGGWRIAADFRSRMLDAKLFHSIYAPATVQNHESAARLYCFYLSQSWKPADGSYRLEVQASDTRDNRAEADLKFSVANGDIQS